MKWLSRLSGRGGEPSRQERADAGGPFDGVPSEALDHIRTAFVPVTEPGEFGTGSGFGGQPFLPDGVDHPICENCEQPKTLLAQLAIDDLPDGTRPIGSGLLQVFYCTSERDLPCDVELEGWAPFSEAHELRFVEVAANGGPSTAGSPFPARRIERWEPVDEIPNWEELRGVGVKLPDAVADRLAKADIPRSGEKLRGWPAWIQGVEYASCRRCGSTMDYLLQIDSQRNVPIMFGDVGTGHVSQCPNDPEELAFAWACS